MQAKTIKYKGKVVFEKLKMPYFRRIPKLFEKDEACFMFINDGEFSVRMPDNYLSFSKGQGILAKCFDYFFETSEKQKRSSEHLDLIGILIHQSIIEEIFQFDVIDYPHTLNYNAKQIEVDSLLENFKNSIDILLENPDLADEVMIKTKLKEFILLLSKKDNAPSHFHFLSGLFKKNETEFKTTIGNNLYSSLSIEEFAKLCAMSISTFKRTFKEIFNEAPAKYFTQAKLKKASELLLNPENRIADIAFDCGFESLATFNRNFKTAFDKSPSEFRKGL